METPAFRRGRAGAGEPRAHDPRRHGPRPLNLRQERFCQAYVLHPNAAAAARQAGYADVSARQQGWRLLATRRIRARLAEIQNQLARDIADGLDPFIGKLEVIYRQALEDRRTLAAVRAVEAQARLVRLKNRLPPPAEEAADALAAELERCRSLRDLRAAVKLERRAALAAPATGAADAGARDPWAPDYK